MSKHGKTLQKNWLRIRINISSFGAPQYTATAEKNRIGKDNRCVSLQSSAKTGERTLRSGGTERFLAFEAESHRGAKEKGNKAQSVQIVWGSLSEQSTSQDGEILSEATTVQEENILSFQALQGSFSQEEGSLRNGQKLVLEDDEGFSLRSFNQVRSMDPCLDEGRCGAKVSPVRVMPRLLLSLAGGEATGIQSLILQTSSPLQEDKESLAGRKVCNIS